jgi:hypothetical protein
MLHLQSSKVCFLWHLSFFVCDLSEDEVFELYVDCTYWVKGETDVTLLGGWAHERACKTDSK